jgi:hypothetical protein
MFNPAIGYTKLGYSYQYIPTGASYEKACKDEKPSAFGVFGCSFHVVSVYCTELRVDKLHTAADATGVPAKSVEPATRNKQLPAANSAATARTGRWAMV